MNHVRVTTITGQEVEIPIDELHRVMKNINPSPPHTAHHAHETNEHYKRRAFDNICELASHHGIHNIADTEKEMKELMRFAIFNDDFDLFGELVEWFIADHTEKTGE